MMDGGYDMSDEKARTLPEVTGLTCDSRRVRPGWLFAAIPGAKADGRQFIAQAIDNGAAAVLAPEDTDPSVTGGRVPLITDPEPRRRYALMAAQFYGRQPETVCAITGTNGKTSTAHFLRQIWTATGHPAASLGTLGVHAFDADAEAVIDVNDSLTTPDAADLHDFLADMKSHGIDHLAIEASSHGLDQYRLDGVRIAAAAFTNLSRDHLDYHPSEAAYLEAKLRLFADLVVDGGAAVVNMDVPYADAVESAARGRGLTLIGYGRAGREIRITGVDPHVAGQSVAFEAFGASFAAELSLAGDFQAWNALAAFGLAVATGTEPAAAAAALQGLRGAPGRMQRVGETREGAAVYVDYAHTPDALANVLRALRPHAQGRLVVVFGAGGDRDAGKRPEMGAVAQQLADHAIVTDDNPRSEDPAAIRRQILAAAADAEEIGDRAEAIHSAIVGLGAGDVLVVAGKGHERGQIVGSEVRPFDDAEQVSAALREVSS